MPRKREWLKVRLDIIYGYIALLELQNRQEHADGLRFLLRWTGYRVDATAIAQHRADLTSFSRNERI